MNGLTVAANDAADVALPKLQPEHRRFAARNFREHHLIGIFDQLPNDKLEKFSHDGKANHESAFAQYYGATGEHESTRISAGIKKQAFDTNVSTPLVAVDRRYRSQS